MKYAIHPVAGRMPGHMNVLLAEANVPYDQLFDLEQINPEFERADVALVIGANDVVNPGARRPILSPIYGMPILDADKAKQRDRGEAQHEPGLRGHRQPDLLLPNTMMLFGDAKARWQAHHGGQGVVGRYDSSRSSMSASASRVLDR